jgi:hypothetical protein
MGGCSGDDGSGHQWGFAGEFSLDDLKSGSITLTVVNKDAPHAVGEAVLTASTVSDAGDGGVSAVTASATSGTITIHYNDDGTFSGTATVNPDSMSGTFSGQYISECFSADPVASGDSGGGFDVGLGDSTQSWYSDNDWSSAFCSGFTKRRGST